MNTTYLKAIAEQQASQARIRLEELRMEKLKAYIEAENKAVALAEELGLSTAEISRVVEKQQQKSSAAPMQFRQTVRKLAASYIEKNGSLPTVKIVELLESDGVEFKAKNKQVAVSQALGITGGGYIFVTDRILGWSLSSQKGESPVDAGLSGVTEFDRSIL